VPLRGGNARRVLFGAVNIRTGHRVLLARRHQRSGDFRAFLRLLRGSYRGRAIALVLDEDPSHTAQASRREAERSGVELLWLPVRCPELNGMDHLWRQGKEHISANRQYDSIAEHVDRFVEYLESLSRYETLVKTGIWSKAFWLRP
jgi:transposase